MMMMLLVVLNDLVSLSNDLTSAILNKGIDDESDGQIIDVA